MALTATDVEEDWQVGKSTLETHKYLLENQIRCDVTFSLTSEDNTTKTVGAHSFILTSRSPVFETMFSERWSGLTGRSKEHPVKIEDITYDAFFELLRYMCYYITLRCSSKPQHYYNYS